MRTPTRAILAIERVVADTKVSQRQRAKWRALLVLARKIDGERDRRGRPRKHDYRKIYDMHTRGMSISSIAEALRISERTVKTAIERVRRADRE